MSTPLNSAQRRAVNHVEGPLLVLAGPGSGKTRVVTQRIAQLLRRGIDPKSILAVTFTNKAAREMRERIRKLVAADKGAKKAATAGGKRGGREVPAMVAKGLTIATFHSACARILREEAEALGYGKNFSIYDDSDQQSLMRSVLRDLSGYGETKSAASVLYEVGAAKANPHDAERDEPDAAASAPFDPEAEARRVFVGHARDRYQSELLARNAMDFDDILLLTLRLFREHPGILARWRDRYRFLLVDEYQDTNRTQDDILTLLAGNRRNLCVVGDDDQSIYGWRGARVDLILEFAKRWGPETSVVTLEQNYRSTAAIVTAARHLIDKNPKRHKKELFTRKGPGAPVRSVELKDDEDEARFIASEIARGIGDKVGTEAWVATAPYAVLFRTNEQMRPIEQALRQAKLPYRLLGGRSFFDRKEVLDVMAHLRLAANPADEEALLRVINTPARGLGAKAIQAVSDRARTAKSSLWDALAEVAAGTLATDDMPRRAPEAVGRFVGAIQRVQTAAARRSDTLVPDLLKDIGYQEELERVYKDVKVQQVRWDLTLEVNKAWISYLADAAEPSLVGFIESLALRDRDDDDDEARGVTLATVHASKGLEFDEVFVAGMEEGFFPHKRSVSDGRELAEERRVLFVALTRARERLTLTRAGERTIRGQSVKMTPSRFLADLAGGEVEEVDGSAPATEAAATTQMSRMRALLGD